MNRTTIVLALVAGGLAACSSPRIVSSAGGAPGGTAGGGGGAGGSSGGGAGGSGGFGFDLDALPPAPDGGSAPSIPIPGGRGGDLPACASETRQAQLAPVDLLLLVDTSGSMNESAGGQSKWQLARATLATFWKDPRSAGLGMGLQFFPTAGTDRTCNADTDCSGAGVGTGACKVRHVCAGAALTLPAQACDPADSICTGGTTCTPVGRCAVSGGDCLSTGTLCPTGAAGDMCLARGKICDNIGGGSCTQGDYQTLAVPITPLPAAEPVLTRAITVKEPIGFTPTGPAVAGALEQLRAQLTANPTHRGALVIMTDGLPLGCGAGDGAAVTASIMAARMASPPILTYAIGVFGANQFNGPDTLDGWARAGGTGAATVVTPNAAFADKLLAALNSIRGAALPCELTIPPSQSGAIDFDKVNLRYTGGSGITDVLYVGQAAKCDPATGGWYYDVDPRAGTPTRVVVCPVTCDRFKGDPAARVDLVFGCATKVIQ
jgi:hypothetical protein